MRPNGYQKVVNCSAGFDSVKTSFEKLDQINPFGLSKRYPVSEFFEDK